MSNLEILNTENNIKEGIQKVPMMDPNSVRESKLTMSQKGKQISRKDLSGIQMESQKRLEDTDRQTEKLEAEMQDVEGFGSQQSQSDQEIRVRKL
jgi:hypothetical protein